VVQLTDCYYQGAYIDFDGYIQIIVIVHIFTVWEDEMLVYWMNG
jgi:hypothetical protein